MFELSRNKFLIVLGGARAIRISKSDKAIGGIASTNVGAPQVLCHACPTIRHTPGTF